MIRYAQLKDIFYDNIEKQCFGPYKQKAYFHSIQVCTWCQILAKKRGLNIELASIIGLFHDYSQFLTHHSYNHALTSSEMTYQIIKNLDFTQEEIKIITTAIRHHSNKDKIDDDYSELIKDADVLTQYCEEPEAIYPPAKQERINRNLH